MKKPLRKVLRRHKRNLDNLAETIVGIDYAQIRLQQKQYIENLLETNRRLLKDFKFDNIIVF
jgi:hypothetical protein